MAKSSQKNLSPLLQAQFDEWLSEQKPARVSSKTVKQAVRDELNQVGSLPSKAFLFWQKWDEIQHVYGNATKEDIRRIEAIGQKIWVPKKPDDYLKLEPELVFVQHKLPITSVNIWGQERLDFYTNPDPLDIDWNALRVFVATMPSGGTVGRSLSFLVRDKGTGKYLGVLCVSGDFFDLGGRDKAIGWTQKEKVDQGMINHTAIGSVIIPTQPFGFNYVGGKLLALLCLSREVAEMWEDIYGYRLVGITTTSLYGDAGGPTQYDGLKHWKRYGSTAGSVPIRLSKKTQELMKNWMHYEHPLEYWKLHVAKREGGSPLIRDANSRSAAYCYRKLGLKSSEFQSGHPRKIYFARLYENTFDFLCCRIEAKKLNPLFDNSTDYLIDLWKTRYAAKRIESLKKKDRVSYASSFYSDLIGLSCHQAKARYPEKVAP